MVGVSRYHIPILYYSGIVIWYLAAHKLCIAFFGAVAFVQCIFFILQIHFNQRVEIRGDDMLGL